MKQGLLSHAAFFGPLASATWMYVKQKVLLHASAPLLCPVSLEKPC